MWTLLRNLVQLQPLWGRRKRGCVEYENNAVKLCVGQQGKHSDNVHHNSRFPLSTIFDTESKDFPMLATCKTATFSVGASSVEMRQVFSPSFGNDVPQALSYSTPLRHLSPGSVLTELSDLDGTTDSAAPESTVNSTVSQSPTEFIWSLCFSSKHPMLQHASAHSAARSSQIFL